MKRIVILGGGMSGLVSAVALYDYAKDKSKRYHITVIEPSTPGGSFTDGGFKYFHGTSTFKVMLADLGIQYTSAPISGGILVDGKVEKYPDYLQDLPQPQLRRRQGHESRARPCLYYSGVSAPRNTGRAAQEGAAGRAAGKGCVRILRERSAPADLQRGAQIQQ